MAGSCIDGNDPSVSIQEGRSLTSSRQAL